MSYKTMQAFERNCWYLNNIMCLYHIPFSVISHIFIIIDKLTKKKQAWKLEKVINIYT